MLLDLVHDESRFVDTELAAGVDTTAQASCAGVARDETSDGSRNSDDDIQEVCADISMHNLYQVVCSLLCQQLYPPRHGRYFRLSVKSVSTSIVLESSRRKAEQF
jgi:hypothetical protein